MRYLRHEQLLGKPAQKKLQKKTITIVGLGALGTNTASLLARAGLNLKLIDFDNVELSNLQRQSLYDEQGIGKPKAAVSASKLKKINSEIKIKAFNEILSSKNLKLLNSDLVIDCTDNMTTRFLINDYCYNNIPWVHSAAIQHTGVVFNILPKRPCLRCLYRKNTDIDMCSSLGVINTLPSAIASIAATQAIKILLNKSPEEKLIRLNIWNNEIEKIIVRKQCPKCQRSL
ncbi:MAG TPA: HesA/MoeB/ThiF family protein [Candidatus Nanoarchaeia archaeon]|nr:HesA/MoeB/ThiF family protein [Candidatus Nanoarchaeia archaeon]